jgi:hypothetical protein
MKYCKATLFIIFCFLQVRIVSGADFVIQQGEYWESFEVSQNWFGTPSPTVDMTGGQVGNPYDSDCGMYTRDFGTLNVFDGTIGYLHAFDSSNVNIIGGSIMGDSVAQGNSTINMFGGYLGDSSINTLYLLDHASLHIDMIDGHIFAIPMAYDSSTVNVYKGTFAYLGLYDNSITDIYGGNIGFPGYGGMEFDPTATLTIHGYNFVYNPHAYGNPDMGWLSELTGDGLYGVPIRLVGLIPDPYTSDNIHLVPEPATLALLILGGLFTLKRRAKR